MRAGVVGLVVVLDVVVEVTVVVVEIVVEDVVVRDGVMRLDLAVDEVVVGDGMVVLVVVERLLKAVSGGVSSSISVPHVTLILLT